MENAKISITSTIFVLCWTWNKNDQKKVHEVNNCQIITIIYYTRQWSFKKYLSDGFYYYAKAVSDICQLPLHMTRTMKYPVSCWETFRTCTPNLINITFVGRLLTFYCLLKKIKEQGFYPVWKQLIEKMRKGFRVWTMNKVIQGWTK